MLKTLYQHREIVYILAYRDIKARGRNAVLGSFWVVIEPLFAVGIFTLIVQGILGLRLTTISYPLFLLAGMVPWTFFTSCLAASVGSLVEQQDLLTHIYFPRLILLVSAMISKAIDLAISLALLVVILLAVGHPLYLQALLALPILLLPALLALGIAMVLAPLNVVARDVAKALPIVLGLLLYLTPVVYPLERIPEAYRFYYLLNPAAFTVTAFRDLVLFGQLPALGLLLAALGISVGLLGLGAWIFGLFEAVLADVI